ncbi:hypothetical protein [Lysobacter sp. HA18]
MDRLRGELCRAEASKCFGEGLSDLELAMKCGLVPADPDLRDCDVAHVFYRWCEKGGKPSRKLCARALEHTERSVDFKRWVEHDVLFLCRARPHTALECEACLDVREDCTRSCFHEARRFSALSAHFKVAPTDVVRLRDLGTFDALVALMAVARIAVWRSHERCFNWACDAIYDVLPQAVLQQNLPMRCAERLVEAMEPNFLCPLYARDDRVPRDAPDLMRHVALRRTRPRLLSLRRCGTMVEAFEPAKPFPYAGADPERQIKVATLYAHMHKDALRQELAQVLGQIGPLGRRVMAHPEIARLLGPSPRDH